MSALPALGAHAPPRDPAALARQILSQPRFRVRVQTPPPRTWWDALRDWLGDRWNQLLDAFSHHVHVGAATSVALGDVLIGVIIVLVVVIGVRLLLSMARESGAADGALAVALAHHADERELYAAARRAAEQGAYAAAIAFLFRAALASLDARGVLRDDPARTVNECRSDVHTRAPRLSAPFDTIARAFTAAVYAEDRITMAQWADVERAYGAFTRPQSDAA